MVTLMGKVNASQLGIGTGGISKELKKFGIFEGCHNVQSDGKCGFTCE